ncbi:Coenzyme F420 hydrogenase/dehydrogenase, beta subunit C-terminal domain [Butyrivibrio sp. JL13D10]|uniref:Coenzyme F420 hydrogenase/dehydrogenase, beta subunit C-terminal domain n=1 Tax=Butyrivibrio sp. JL13D10 TaxID=3236815 RepID=UPI0038B487F2
MIDVRKKSDCCGCGVCVDSCPIRCISMQNDAEGFCYPKVDKSKCINCNLCTNRCPIINSTEKKDNYISGFVARSYDATRNESSSGGIFYLIAKYVIIQRGIVVGAAFDSEWNVHHICIDRLDRINDLLGSKYVQSSTCGVFQQIKSRLDDDRLVLFSGTGCQIAALKSFLCHDYSNLLTVDILCHGVPSPKVWRIYLNSVKNEFSSDIQKVTFRDKRDGWHNYSNTIRLSSGQIVTSVFTSNLYMNMFLSNFSLRPSCYNCRFKGLERTSDLTIGDAWGIEKVMPDFDDDKGTSLVIVHSSKGEKILKWISNSVEMREVDIDSILPRTADSRMSVHVPETRAIFMYYLKHGKSITKLIECMNLENNIRVRIKNRFLRIFLRNSI